MLIEEGPGVVLPLGLVFLDEFGVLGHIARFHNPPLGHVRRHILTTCKPVSMATERGWMGVESVHVLAPSAVIERWE